MVHHAQEVVMAAVILQLCHTKSCAAQATFVQVTQICLWSEVQLLSWGLRGSDHPVVQ